MNKLIYKLQRRFIRSYEYDINYSEMKDILRKNSDVIIIDVRNKDEYIYNHLKGAVNIPMQDIISRISEFSKNKNDIIILYCEYGGRSKKALNKLRKIGYVNVYNLEGGLEAI